MDNQFISSVRSKINKTRKKRKIINFSLKLLPVFIFLYIYFPGISGNYNGNSKFISGSEPSNTNEYILSQEDILLYLIDELDVDEFLSISSESDLFEDSIINERDI